MLEKIKQTADFLRQRAGEMPKLAIILGTGLGNLVDHIEEKLYIPYSEIPNFPVSTVQGHSGNLIFGKMGGKRVMAMQGRFHYYEGYDMKAVTFPVRVFKALGVETLFVSNAAGGMNKEFKVGDVMIITDHINLFPENPLRGKNYEELGPRFPAMTEAYDKKLVALADQIGTEKGLRLMHGVYIGTPGPTFETPAEYEYFRIIGRRRRGYVDRARSHCRKPCRHARVRPVGNHRPRRQRHHRSALARRGTESRNQSTAHCRNHRQGDGSTLLKLCQKYPH